MESLNLNATMSTPPTHLPSDFVEISFLSAILIIGVPLNLFVFIRQIVYLKKNKSESLATAFLVVKLNLNVTDLMVLLIHSLGKLCWLTSYEWLGGGLLCRGYKFLSIFSLYANSNVVMCVAIDRARNVLYPSRRLGIRHVTAVQKLLAVAWGAAVFESLPQLFVWDTLNVFPQLEQGWHQCVDIWTIRQFRNTHSEWDGTFQNVYDIIHLLTVFWLPFAVLIVCYSLIAGKLIHYTHWNKQQRSRSPNSSSLFNRSSFLSSGKQHLAGWKRMDEQEDQFSSHQKRKKKISKLALPRKRRRRRKAQKATQHLKPKMFRATAMVVAVHTILWFPYNGYAIMRYVNPELYIVLSDHANILKSLMVVNSLVNPFLYGFS